MCKKAWMCVQRVPAEAHDFCFLQVFYRGVKAVQPGTPGRKGRAALLGQPHVVDLARGHVKAIQKLADKDGVNIYNLGTGKGYSVLDVIHAFEKACGKKLPYVIKPRRAGDIATCYSKCDKAAAELGWTAQYDIDEMCADSWNWQTKNPNGYND